MLGTGAEIFCLQQSLRFLKARRGALLSLQSNRSFSWPNASQAIHPS